jgi:hypothetical protein
MRGSVRLVFPAAGAYGPTYGVLAPSLLRVGVQIPGL